MHQPEKCRIADMNVSRVSGFAIFDFKNNMPRGKHICFRSFYPVKKLFTGDSEDHKTSGDSNNKIIKFKTSKLVLV
jgi:hypothetical protein